MDPLTVGMRVQYGESRGFVRYLGRVDGKGDTEWVGVEWDDSQRGIHSGSVNGKQYFTCSKDNSGSFVKAGKIADGGRKSLLHAVQQRFLGDALDTRYKHDRHVVGGGEVHINARDLTSDDYALGKLEIVDVSGLGVAFLGDGDGEQMGSVQELRVGKSLFTSPDVVMNMFKEFENLTVLDASRNVLGKFEHLSTWDGVRNWSMKVVILNHCSVSWDVVLDLGKGVPNLEELRLHNCGIGSLKSEVADGEQFAQMLPKLQVVDMDSNELCWEDILSYLGRLPKLEELYLSNNKLEDSNILQGMGESEKRFGELKSLSLSDNMIQGWKVISSLNQLETLESLRMRGTGIMEECETGYEHLTGRMRIIGRIKHLRRLDGSTISGDERAHAEKKYYEVECVGGGWHPRKSELEKIYEGSVVGRKRGNLIGEQLVQVRMRWDDGREGEEVYRNIPRGTGVGRVVRIGERLLRAECKVEYRVGWRAVKEQDFVRQLSNWVADDENSVDVVLVKSEKHN